LFRLFNFDFSFNFEHFVEAGLSPSARLIHCIVLGIATLRSQWQGIGDSLSHPSRY
jgi:hypothetical protein